MKQLFFVFIATLIVSCAPIYVNYDYETGTDFNHYKTYNMFPDIQTGLSALDTKRLLNAIDQYLQSKGYIVSETPDFYVNVTSSEFQGDNRNTVGAGIGGGGRNVVGGISIGIPVGNTGIHRELTFDFIDVKKDALFWQAVSESNFNPKTSPEKRNEKFKDIVAKVFIKYPPKNNKSR